jgi:hypothetical protein
MQAASQLGEVLFLSAAIFSLAQLVRMAVRAVQRKPLCRPVAWLGGALGGYALLLAASGFAARADVRLPPGAEKCFDDWCVSLAGAREVAAIGDLRPIGRFVVVELAVRNAARRATFSPSRPRLALLDESGRAFAPSTDAARKLDALSGAARALDSVLGAGDSLRARAVFDVPAGAGPLDLDVAEGGGPVGLIAFDEEAPLHGRLLMPLALARP